MIDHLNIGVADLPAARAFYLPALAPLGYEVILDREWGVGLGHDGKPDFWISDRPTSAPLHVAFAAADRAAVTRSTPPRSPRAAATTAARASGRSTTRTTTARSSSTRRATTWRP
jgi:catechol 2,3-dioxygenase-like lactoylglutathione lyase family enzyme